MRVLVRFINQKVRSAAAAETLVLQGSQLRIGRGTDQEIHLNSLRVALAHAELQETPDGRVRLVSRLSSGVLCNGEPLQAALLSPGHEFEIGGFRLQVGSEEGYTLSLQIREDSSGREEALKDALLKRSTLSLAAAGARRRPWALGLAGLILVLGLGVPLATGVFGLGKGDKAGPSREAWSAGALTSAHAHLGAQCEACHRAPFERTRNDRCTACHQAMPGHLAHQDDTPDPAKDARCGSCHHEHDGPAALVQQDEARCVACHADLHQTRPDTTLGKVTGFASGHPQFKASLPQPGGHVARVAVDDTAALHETSGLKFSHADHLAKDGVRGPDKTRKQLACHDCHQPAGDGGMAPVRYETACASCHALKVPGTAHESLPHGAPAQVIRAVENHFLAAAMRGGYPDLLAPLAVQTRRRPGVPLTQPQQQEALGWAQQEAAVTVDEMFEFSTCGGCHSFTRKPDGAWQMTPVAVPTRWFPAARFDHARHDTQKCASCHADVAKSDDSGNVSLPGIETCRDCHGDARPAANKVASACVSCHGFHAPAPQAALQAPASKQD